MSLPTIDPDAPAPSLSVPEAVGPARGSYAFVSLGCPKNLVDSEKMLGTLAVDGYTLVPDPAQSDFVIVNTCGFIESSRQESHVLEIHDLPSGQTDGILVYGHEC